MNTWMEYQVGTIPSVLMTFDSRKIFVLYVILLVLNLQGKMQQKTAEAQTSNSLTVYIYIQSTNLGFAR